MFSPWFPPGTPVSSHLNETCSVTVCVSVYLSSPIHSETELVRGLRMENSNSAKSGVFTLRFIAYMFINMHCPD